MHIVEVVDPWLKPRQFALMQKLAQSPFFPQLAPVFSGIGADHEILADGEVGENHASLGNMGQAAAHDLVGRQAGNISTGINNLAGFGGQQAGNGFEGGGFAGAIAANQRDDAAGGD